MASADITAVVMPKLGMTMTEGKVVDWQVNPGDTIEEGEEIVGVETEKITNVCEAPATGVFQRRVAEDGDVLPVGALIGIIAASEVPGVEIDAFIAGFTPVTDA